jgi:hypothetical protein
MAGGAMLSRWRLREQMLDGATRGGGVGDAKRRRRYGGQQRWMGSSPAAGATAIECRCPLRLTTETTKTRARDDATRREGGGATTRDKRQATTARQGAMHSRHGGGEVW